jgi:heat shock protein HtpX
MATLYTQQSKNVTKTWLLMAVFFVVVVLFGWFFSFYYNNLEILYFFVIFSVLMNFFSYWFSDKIVLRLAGARAASREEYFNLYTSVENLSITAGLPMPKVYVVMDPAPNAFATGRDKDHAVVCVTTGLLQILDKTELEGVIAHELSHIGNRDMLLSTVIVVLVGFVTILADVFTRSTFLGGHRDNNKGHGVFIIIGIILSILAPIFVTLIQLAISRKREFLADASGALLTRYPEGLVNALKKISQ